MTFLADAEMVTVGVTDLDDAGMALPAYPSGAVTVYVYASLADAGMVTVGVTDLADAGAVPLADAGIAFPAEVGDIGNVGVHPWPRPGLLPWAWLMGRMRLLWMARVLTFVVIIHYRPESGVGGGGGTFRVNCMISLSAQ